MRYKRGSLEHALRKKDFERLKRATDKIRDKRGDGGVLNRIKKLDPSLIVNLCRAPKAERGMKYLRLSVIFDFLVESGLSLNKIADSHSKKTCLMEAAKWSRALSLLMVLNGVDVNAVDKRGHDALYYAALANDEESPSIVKMLLDNDADPSASLFDLVSKTQDQRVAELLLEKMGGSFTSEMANKLLLHLIENYATDTAEYVLRHCDISRKRSVIAYEILGFNAVFREEFEKASGFLSRALELRNDPADPIPKPPNSSSWSDHVECETVEELNELFARSKVAVLREAVSLMERYKYCKLEEVFVCFSNIRDLRMHVEEGVELLEYLLENYANRPSVFLRKNIFSCIIEILVEMRRDVAGAELPSLQHLDVLGITKVLTIQLKIWAETYEKFCETITPLFLYLIYLLHVTGRSELERQRTREQVQLVLVTYSQIPCEETLLHAATGTYDCGVIGLMIDCGARVNAVDKAGNTPLFVAVRNRGVDVVRLLLARGAHVDGRCGDGRRLSDLILQRVDCGGASLVFEYTSLQCLCARTIKENNVEYEGKTPLPLQNFIQLH